MRLSKKTHSLIYMICRSFILIIIVYLALRYIVSYRDGFQNLDSNGQPIQKLAETIDNVALLIPVYPPHYELVYKLINKLKINNIHIDIYCIFSNTNEYELFQMKNMIREIIPESVPSDKSVIEYKRLYGLKLMINKPYDYIISCVSETDIILENFTKNNITKKINDIFTDKKLYGIDMSSQNLFKDIMTACANVYTGDDYERIIYATNNLSLYTYFYNIPVYKREHIQDFLKKINYDNLKLTWFNFDNLTYDYYLIAVQGFQLVDVTQIAHDDGHGMYIDNTENFMKLKELGFGFGNVGSKFWKLMGAKLIKEGTFLLINTDRSV